MQPVHALRPQLHEVWRERIARPRNGDRELGNDARRLRREDENAIAEEDCLFQVVRNENHCPLPVPPDVQHLLLHALARLESMGVLQHTISQNIDNLHFEAGSVAVTEIHGNRTKVRCIDCGARWAWSEFAVTDVPPACPQCGGVVKGDTVMFGEPIPRTFLSECQSQAERADCVIIAGTSATVTPAAYFPEIVLQAGGVVIEVNPEPTSFSSLAVAALRGPAGEMLPALVERVAQMLTARSGAREA